MRIAILVGTRPEIIKMSPVIRECNRLNLDSFIVDSGQHFSYNMSKLFFDELNLPQPLYSLGVTSKSPALQGDHTGRMLMKIEQVLTKEKPDVVLVQGDTITVLAGSLCAQKLGIPAGHVEAGLRSYDRSMPEEVNRVLSDHISTYLFAPTENAKQNALREGVDAEKIHVTGNTIVDAVMQHIEIAKTRCDITNGLGIHGDYFLVTAHRQENVDVKYKLEGILNGLHGLYEETGIESIYSLHPRTKKMMNMFNIDVPRGIRMIEPVGFLEFLQLESKARLILTDSGGLQEEACILGVPCITLRENTERPETIDAGCNMLAGTDSENILECAKIMLSKSRTWSNPLGDGNAAKKIVDICTR
ncbi:MAG: UDP-N-acetylglucosamine 2-epimerase (non-hydrolyzing) [Candidatus Aenigmatarchaeota archaeon]